MAITSVLKHYNRQFRPGRNIPAAGSAYSWFRRLAAVAILAGMNCGQLSAQGMAERVEAGLASPDRPAEERARDAARRPVQVLEFLGVDNGMTVIDLLAAGGWYTEVLSAAVGPDGKVYSQNPDRMKERVGAAAQARADRLGNVELLYTADMVDLGLDGVADAAITALNLHDAYNFRGEQGGLDFLKGVFKALKPGGVIGVIDHRGIAGQDNGTLHRLDPAVARKLLTDTGFVIDGESDVLQNPDDDHTLPIRDASLQRNSDRFLIKAHKP